MSDQWLSDDEIRAVAVECGEDEQTVRDLADAMQCCAEEENLLTEDIWAKADVVCSDGHDAAPVMSEADVRELATACTCNGGPLHEVWCAKVRARLG